MKNIKVGGIVREQVVYIDILLGVNLLINYFLLLITARLAGVPPNRWRLFGASALGAVYSLAIFAPKLPLPLDLLLKALLAATITAAAFGIKGKRLYLRAYCVFLAATFLFGGIFLTIYILTAPEGMLVNNSTIYFNISALQLVIYTITAYLALTLAGFVARRRAPQELAYRVIISYGGRQAALEGIVDTGNSLKETFSQAPVAICGLKELRELLPARLYDILACDDVTGAMQRLSASEFAATVRVVPYHDVSGEGLLYAFRPDGLTLEQNGKVRDAKSVYVGISPKPLSRMDFACILNPQIIELSTEKRSAHSYER